MTIEVFKKFASKEQYEYLRDLEYQPCNLPNVGVHYGDVRAICISRESSAYVSEGNAKSFTEQNGNIYSKYYRMIDYLKAYKYFEYASNHFILKGDHRIYHKDVKIEIVNIYVR